jgi:GNAT superfamily N-acetyltransferase
MVEILPATARDLGEIRQMLGEYQRWIGLDLSFQHFQQELDGLPGDYAPPAGRLLVARAGGGQDAGPAARGEPLTGMVALRRVDAARCEMKRLFVRSSARGLGVGRQLAHRIIDEARAIGYREMLLDTLPMMQDAQRLYVALGFVDIAPYYASPIAGTRFMSLALA